MEGGVLVVVSSFSVPLAFVPGERLPLELGGYPDFPDRL